MDYPSSDALCIRPDPAPMVAGTGSNDISGDVQTCIPVARAWIASDGAPEEGARRRRKEIGA